MDDLSIQRDIHSSPDTIKNMTNYLRQYPQDIVDAKRLLKKFRVSAHEFYQALLAVYDEPASSKMVH